LGVSNKILQNIRAKTARERILEAAKLALAIDDEPNSDFIEYIAGYEARSAVYHHFQSMTELLGSLGPRKIPKPLPPISLTPMDLDLSTTIPISLRQSVVHMDAVENTNQITVWQKVNGGMRLVSLNRRVSRVLFLAGVCLYAGEGTKSLGSSKVELANSNPGILRLYVQFLESLGVPSERLIARVQIHSAADLSEAQDLWERELTLSSDQFRKPLVSPPREITRRRTFTLQLSYYNSMLFTLLRWWTSDLESIIRVLDSK
jgi:hypothetical protein